MPKFRRTCLFSTFFPLESSSANFFLPSPRAAPPFCRGGLTWPHVYMADTWWLRHASPGFCSVTGDTDPSSCSDTSGAKSGAFGLSQHASQNLSRAVRACLRRCARCARCRYITINTEYRDCSWYEECDMHALHRHPAGFLSGRAVALPADRREAASMPAQRVVLFVHLEKTAGTLVRSLFKSAGWNRSAYCKTAHVMVADLRSRLRRGETHIFLEHHCRIDWNLPSTLARVALAHAKATGSRIRFRSFTVLRSPLTLAYSQFNAWHTELKVRVDRTIVPC